ncbi:hypothetical protein [Streptomyces sp. NPDC005096]|uniref:hypothetical protein n=1 Tax=Streptomyces sp. NPDC005096 TaxID=3154559 RepID=UPI0033A9A407
MIEESLRHSVHALRSLGHAGLGRHRAAAAGKAADGLRCQDRAETESTPRSGKEHPVKNHQITAVRRYLLDILGRAA